MQIIINVKESLFSAGVVKRWHDKASEPQSLYEDLVRVSENLKGISSPDLQTLGGGGLNGRHLKQSHLTYDFYRLLKNGCSWSVSIEKRHGYTAYVFELTH